MAAGAMSRCLAPGHVSERPRQHICEKGLFLPAAPADRGSKEAESGHPGREPQPVRVREPAPLSLCALLRRERERRPQKPGGDAADRPGAMAMAGVPLRQHRDRDAASPILQERGLVRDASRARSPAALEEDPPAARNLRRNAPALGAHDVRKEPARVPSVPARDVPVDAVEEARLVARRYLAQPPGRAEPVSAGRRTEARLRYATRSIAFRTLADGAGRHFR